MKLYFVTNPAAGKKNSCDELYNTISSTCQEKGVSFEIYKTACVGDATSYVDRICSENAEDEDLRFFACGGDGTLSEVIAGAIGHTNASVGLIPKGTGNDFVRNFTNKELFFDIDAQVNGSTVTVDALKCNDKYAINMINIGFDCEVVKKMVQVRRSPLVPSKLAYIFGLIFTLIKKPGVNPEISVNGEDYAKKSLLLTTIANGCYCGGGFHSNPYALLNDGNINVLFVNNISRVKFLGLVSSYKSGTHIVPKNADILSTDTVSTLDLRFPVTQTISVDGELHDIERDLHIEAIRGAIRFIVPKGCSFAKEQCAEEMATV